MVKKVISIVVVLVMALAMLTACTDSEMQKRVDELEANAQKQADRIQELEEDLQSKSNKIKGLEEDLQNKSDKIKDLEDKNDELQEQIWELENTFIKSGGDIEVKGRFYGFEEAYEQGWLTQEDLMNISYFNQGRVIKGTSSDYWSDWELIDFTPTIEMPIMDKKIEWDIKKAGFISYENVFAHLSELTGEKYGPKDLPISKYYGNYNGSYVVVFNEDNLFPDSSTSTGGVFVSIGGIIFTRSLGFPFYSVFRYN